MSVFTIVPLQDIIGLNDCYIKFYLNNKLCGITEWVNRGYVYVFGTILQILSVTKEPSGIHFTQRGNIERLSFGGR